MEIKSENLKKVFAITFLGIISLFTSIVVSVASGTEQIKMYGLSLSGLASNLGLNETC